MSILKNFPFFNKHLKWVCKTSQVMNDDGTSLQDTLKNIGSGSEDNVQRTVIDEETTFGDVWDSVLEENEFTAPLTKDENDTLAEILEAMNFSKDGKKSVKVVAHRLDNSTDTVNGYSVLWDDGSFTAVTNVLVTPVIQDYSANRRYVLEANAYDSTSYDTLPFDKVENKELTYLELAEVSNVVEISSIDSVHFAYLITADSNCGLFITYVGGVGVVVIGSSTDQLCRYYGVAELTASS